MTNDNANEIKNSNSIYHYGRIFHCGSTGPSNSRRFSVYGIFLANAFLPEFEGDASNNEAGLPLAVPLTSESLNDATEDDLLVMHMHQYCEVNYLDFPGKQLHLNVSHVV